MTAHPMPVRSTLVGCNELLNPLILLSVLFLHSLNVSQAYSNVGSGHFVIFPQEWKTEGWGM